MSISDKIKPSDLCMKTVVLKSADLKPEPSFSDLSHADLERFDFGGMSDEEKFTVLCESERRRSADMRERAEKILKKRYAATLGIGLDELAGINDYDSPIKIFNQRITTQLEDNVMKAVHSADIEVDKQELIRALRYDRDQYRKGYEAAKNEEPTASWIIDFSQLSCTCSNCHRSYRSQTMYSISPDYGELPKYCPDCGRRMRRKKDV